MRIEYTSRAQQDLRDIFHYIDAHNPAAARRVLTRIRDFIGKTLSVFPDGGRKWEGGPTRAISIAGLSYRVHYRVIDAGDLIQILRIYHTARLPPDDV